MQAKLKICFSVVVFLALVLLVFPLVDGYLFRKSYNNYLSVLGNEQRIKVIPVEYNEGWFSSDVKFAFQSTNPQYPSFVVTLVQHITHGPIIFDPVAKQWTLAKGIIKTELHLPLEMELMVLGNQAVQGLMQATTVATFNDEYVSNFKIPLISKNIPHAGAVSWQGLNGETVMQVVGNRLNHAKSDFTIGAISGQSPSANFMTKDMSINYDVTSDISGLWNGNYRISVPQVALVSPTGNFNLANFQLNDKFNVVNGNYDNDMYISVDQLVVPDCSFSQSNIDLAFKNINAAGLASFVKAAKNAQGQMLTQQDYAAFSAYIPNLITPATNVGYSATINSSYGHFISDANANWPDGVKDVSSIATNANAKLNIRIAVALVNKIIEDASQKAQQSDASDSAVLQVDDPSQNDSNQPSEANLLNQIDAMASDGKIEADTSEKLKDLVQAHLSQADFAKNVDEYVRIKDLSADVAGQLKFQYFALLTYQKNPHPVAVAQPIKPVTASSPADQMKQQLNAYIKAGYIIQDKDDYVTSVDYEKGVLKVNGHVIQ